MEIWLLILKHNPSILEINAIKACLGPRNSQDFVTQTYFKFRTMLSIIFLILILNRQRSIFFTILFVLCKNSMLLFAYYPVKI